VVLVQTTLKFSEPLKAAEKIVLVDTFCASAAAAAEVEVADLECTITEKTLPTRRLLSGSGYVLRASVKEEVLISATEAGKAYTLPKKVSPETFNDELETKLVEKMPDNKPMEIKSELIEPPSSPSIAKDDEGLTVTQILMYVGIGLGGLLVIIVTVFLGRRKCRRDGRNKYAKEHSNTRQRLEMEMFTSADQI
jgi:hypothetical protein